MTHLELILLLSHWVLLPALGLRLAVAIYARRRKAAWVLLTVSALLGLLVALPYGVRFSNSAVGGGLLSARYVDPLFAPRLDAVIGLLSISVRKHNANPPGGHGTPSLVTVSHLGPFGWHVTRLIPAESYSEPARALIYRERDVNGTYQSYWIPKSPSNFDPSPVWRLSFGVVSPWDFVWWAWLTISLGFLLNWRRMYENALPGLQRGARWRWYRLTDDLPVKEEGPLVDLSSNQTDRLEDPRAHYRF
jgi:hypothetical protein